MVSKRIFIPALSLLLVTMTQAQVMRPGAERTGEYFPLLKGKRIAVVANQSSLVSIEHLVDTLLHSGINVIRIFCPEHGFRGNVDEGQPVSSYTDKRTGLEVVSLYGKKLKPSKKDLEGIDMFIFDIQDVGVRFYTYLSTLQYVMDACAENDLPLLILDRPNPNGFYIDGPVLDLKFRSFVGLNPIPVVYGMTIGEYAQMVNNEGWLKNKIKCKLLIIKCEHYDHNWSMELPVRPSPNLPNLQSILLYPSICLFEGTIISVGRGTDYPFQVFGHPELKNCTFKFTPRSIPGTSNYPMYKGIECFGLDLHNFDRALIYKNKKLVLDWLILAYNNSANKDSFFNSYFDSLAGNSILKNQIRSGQDPESIRESWKHDLEVFMVIRKKYLLYNDF